MVLFVACALNESFFVALYMIAHGKKESTMLMLWYAILILSAPVFVFKQIMNVIQLVGACEQLVRLDVNRKQ